MDQGDVVVSRHVLFCISQQPLPQVFDVFGLDGKAGCHRMAAKLDEQVFRRLQGFVHIEAADAPARALADAVADGDDQSRAVVFFDKARCGNADDADVPAFMTGNEDAVPSLLPAFDLGDGLFGNGVLDVLTLGVEFTELRSGSCRFFVVRL